MFRYAKALSGKVMNLLGIPGFIQPAVCDDRMGVPIEVKVGDIFTEVTVKNIRLLFHRVTGRFNGVVLDQNDCQTRP